MGKMSLRKWYSQEKFKLKGNLNISEHINDKRQNAGSVFKLRTKCDNSSRRWKEAYSVWVTQ